MNINLTKLQDYISPVHCASYLPSVHWYCWMGGRKGMVICLEQGANDLHMVHLMPLPPHHLLLQ